MIYATFLRHTRSEKRGEGGVEATAHTSKLSQRTHTHSQGEKQEQRQKKKQRLRAYKIKDNDRKPRKKSKLKYKPVGEERGVSERGRGSNFRLSL